MNYGYVIDFSLPIIFECVIPDMISHISKSNPTAIIDDPGLFNFEKTKIFFDGESR